jgi:hypothetical protein
MTGGKRLRTWTVHFGSLRNVYYTWYHAEQFGRALTRDGTRWRMEVGHEWV